MRAVVDAAQPARIHVAVDLRRRERGVAEQLLDRAEIGAALEQVRSERVAQPVWVAEQAADGARVETSAAHREEQRVVGAARELRPRLAQVPRDVVGGLLAERHHAQMRRVKRVRAVRPFIVVLVIALVSALAIAAVGSESHAGATKSLDPIRSARPGSERAIGYRITKLQPGKLQQAAIAWHGGAIVTSTGETVNVLVSDSFAPDAVTPEGWAEFLAKLVHGPELSSLTTYIAPLTEITQLCGTGALGCYRQNRSVALGETLPDGTTPEEVVRHEYGHHIALYRSNAPWQAIDWGPKNWASAADICARVQRNEAYPGNEDDHYAQNPGEACAAVRLPGPRRRELPPAHDRHVGGWRSEARLEAGHDHEVATRGEEVLTCRSR